MRIPSVTGLGGAIHGDGLRKLEIAPVEKFGFQLARIDVFHAADIDRHHLVALGVGAFGERRYPAIRAEMMGQQMFVELVGSQILPRRLQAELGGGNEMQQAAAFLAKRAVAIQHRADLAFEFIGDLAAMTAAFMGHGLIWPVPRTTYLKVVSCSAPTGPRACILPVPMPISAPMPNSPPSANCVDALCITIAESSPDRNRSAAAASSVTIDSVCCEP